MANLIGQTRFSAVLFRKFTISERNDSSWPAGYPAKTVPVYSRSNGINASIFQQLCDYLEAIVHYRPLSSEHLSKT